MCPPKAPKVVTTPTEHPNSRLANPMAYDSSKVGAVGLADNSQKLGFDAFKLKKNSNTSNKSGL
jgi:hypothetical protein